MAASADQDYRPPAHHRLTRAAARGLRHRCGVKEGAHVLVAVSGGADSVALLRALVTLAPRRKWRLTLSVGHVQHHLRQPEAEHDARFVEALAAELGLDFHRVDLTPPPRPRPRPGAANIESWARRQRYAALAQMAETCGAEFISTAHHADDQLETLLMRMLRGTGVAGLRGIAWRRRLAHEGLSVVRPMLGVTRAEVLDFLQTLGQAWREDHTNADLTRDRARLRHEVLPVLRAMRGDAARRAVALADHARAVQRVVRGEIARQHERLVTATGDGWALDRPAARGLSRVVLTGLLRHVLRGAGVPGDRLTRRSLAPIARAVRDRRGGERGFELAGGVRVGVGREVVTVTPTPGGS